MSRCGDHLVIYILIIVTHSRIHPHPPPPFSREHYEHVGSLKVLGNRSGQDTHKHTSSYTHKHTQTPPDFFVDRISALSAKIINVTELDEFALNAL